MSLTRILTSFLTMGATNTTVGNATQNANPQAFNQIEIMPSTQPTLKILITRDIKQDISSAIKSANTTCSYFFEIIFFPKQFLIYLSE